MNGIILPHDIKRYIRKKAIVYLVKYYWRYRLPFSRTPLSLH